MRVAAIRVRAIGGIEELEIHPGKITRVEGKNGAGKTSLLKALRWVLEGGHDAELLRRGSEEGEAVVVLEDAEAGTFDVEKRITAAGSKVTVRHAEAGAVAAPQRWLDQRVNGALLNPVRFLLAKPKERVDILLAALPARADEAQLAALVGPWIRGLVKLDAPALVVLDTVRQMVFARRTERNTEARDKGGTVRTLREGLPALGEDPGATLADARAALRVAQEARTKFTQANETVMREEIAAAAAARDAALAEAHRQFEGARAAALEGAKRAATREVPGLDTTVERAAAVVAAAEAAVQNHARAAGARDQLKRIEGEVTAAKAEAERLSGALDGIDGMKGALLRDLPVDGLEIRDGDLYVRGLPFDALSTAERVTLAFELARRRSGGIPLMLVDGAEALDAEHLAAFEAAARATPGLQLVLARVSEGPGLRVTTEA